MTIEIIKAETNISSKFAVFRFKNNQYKVFEGEKLHLPYVKEMKEGEIIKFNDILLTHNKVGTPIINDVIVTAKCLAPLHKGRKVIAFRYKSKKNVRVKKGHRSKLTYIEISKINFGK